MNSKVTMMARRPRFGMSASTYFNWPDQWIIDIAKDIQSKELTFNPVTLGVSLNINGELLAFSWKLKHIFDDGCIVIVEET